MYIKFFFTFILSLTVLSLMPQIGFSENIGYVTSSKGKVYIKLQNSKTLSARKGLSVEEGSYVYTGSKSSAKIKLFTGSQIEIGPKSKMKILKNRVKNRKGNTFSISLFLGKLAMKVSKLRPAKDRFHIYTPSAIAGIRGTDFSVTSALDGSSQVHVTEGKVNVSKKVGDVNDVNLVPGEQVVSELSKEENLSKQSTKKNKDWLEKRNKKANEEAEETLTKMIDHLKDVEKEAEQLATESENHHREMGKKDESALKKEYLNEKQKDSEFLSHRFNHGSIINETLLHNAKEIVKNNKSEKSVKKKYSYLNRMNKSINKYIDRIENALRRLDNHLEAGHKRIQDSFDKKGKEIDDKFDEMDKKIKEF